MSGITWVTSPSADRRKIQIFFGGDCNGNGVLIDTLLTRNVLEQGEHIAQRIVFTVPVFSSGLNPVHNPVF